MSRLLRVRAQAFRAVSPLRHPPKPSIIREIHDDANPSSSTSSSKRPSSLSSVFNKPSWSVRSLLPSNNPSEPSETITTSTLHHLLRLSALPLPKTPEEEAKMIQILQSQLHFVRSIQEVDTTDVKPLRSIRDETKAGVQEATIGMDTVKHILDQEVAFGHNKRPRRAKPAKDPKALNIDWDPLATASRKTGGFFVVNSGK